MQSSDEIDLFQIQTAQLNEVLSAKEQNLWKILIFDSFNQLTLSTLFKVKDIREHNITLYMNITERREQLFGVTAFYMVQPTIDNVNLILADFEDELYSTVSIHFTSEPSNHILSSLAKGISSRYPKQLHKVHRVTHSFLGYHVVDRTMTLLSNEQQFANLLVQFKHPPVFLYQKTEQPFAVAVKDRLDAFKAPNLFEDTTGYTAVIIVGRQSDYSPILFHQITYGGLMADVFEMPSYNKVKTGSQVHDFDVKDEVWTDKKHMMISDFDLERDINKIKARQNTLKQNMEEFAELTERNKRLDWHLVKANDLIIRAKERQLNTYSAIGIDLISTKKLSKQNKKTMLQLLAAKGETLDKIRLILLYILCSDDLSSLQQFEKFIEGERKCLLYTQIKQRRLKEVGQQRQGSAKFIKSFAKGILKNFITGQKKFLVTRLAEQIIKGSGLADSGFESLETRRCDNRVKKTIVYVRGGVSLTEYQNLREFVGEVIYCGDRLLHARQMLE